MQSSGVYRKLFKGASWLFLFTLISQIFSWAITILVARILNPGDYGLMELGTILVGYAGIFSELGLGSAIIQRTNSTQEELSSVFWSGAAISLIIAASCFPIAHVSALVFNDQRVIPLGQTISIIFILGGLQIVPASLLLKRLEFKKVGFIEMVSALVSSGSMLLIALFGGGVWTLVVGMIVRSFSKLVMLYSVLRWLPNLHFDYNELKAYLKFGLAVALARSLFYVYSSADRFFAGRLWDNKTLGYYTFALNLSQLPTEKITVLINQVSFPVLSSLQNNQPEFRSLYLKIIKATTVLVMPLFFGGFLLSENLIKVFLGNKWVAMEFIFKYLCLTQIVTSLNAVNGFVHNAQGRPHWSLCFHASLACLMPFSFFFAAKHGLNAMLIPWFTTYIIVCGAWIYVTIRKIGVSVSDYILNISRPIIATLLMSIIISASGYIIAQGGAQWDSFLLMLMGKVFFGGLFYLGYLWVFEKQIIEEIKGLWKSSLHS